MTGVIQSDIRGQRGIVVHVVIHKGHRAGGYAGSLRSYGGCERQRIARCGRIGAGGQGNIRVTDSFDDLRQGRRNTGAAEVLVAAIDNGDAVRPNSERGDRKTGLSGAIERNWWAQDGDAFVQESYRAGGNAGELRSHSRSEGQRLTEGGRIGSTG